MRASRSRSRATGRRPGMDRSGSGRSFPGTASTRKAARRHCWPARRTGPRARRNSSSVVSGPPSSASGRGGARRSTSCCGAASTREWPTRRSPRGPFPGRSRAAAGSRTPCAAAPARRARRAGNDARRVPPRARPSPSRRPAVPPRSLPGRRRARKAPAGSGPVHTRPTPGRARTRPRSAHRPGTPGRRGGRSRRQPPWRPRRARPACASGRGATARAGPATRGPCGTRRPRRRRPPDHSTDSADASSPITRPGTNFSRSFASRSFATAGLSFSHWRAFSLPWPMRSPL